jgi:SAM-dependent methyltransferase
MITRISVKWWHGYETLLAERTMVHPEEVEPLKKMLRDQVRGMYYNPIPYLEFMDIPPLRHYPHQRLEAVMSRVNFTDKVVVDIGANMGYYAFMAAELGAQYVIPIETYLKGCEVMEKVAHIYDLGQIDVCSYNNVKDFPFEKVKPDIVFAFSVLPYLGQPEPQPLHAVLQDMAKHSGLCYIEMGDGGSELEWCKGDEAFENLFRSNGFLDVVNLGLMNTTHANTKRTLWECRGAK